jgi:hypothetical protein
MIVKKDMLIGTALGLVLGTAGAILAQGPPPVDIGNRHGNMRAAQQLIQQAWEKIDAAQVDNRYNLGGHAGRAKDLLSQASSEVKQAAEVANQHER